MPRCKDCTHYQSKSFPEMPWNYECTLGHSTPDYGDTTSCSDFEEQYTIGMERGWSYREEREREGKTCEDNDGAISECSDNNVDENTNSQQNDYHSYSGGYSSSSDDNGVRVLLVVITGTLFFVHALYFVILNHKDPLTEMARYLERNIMSSTGNHSFLIISSITYAILLILQIFSGYTGVPLSIVVLIFLLFYIAYIYVAVSSIIRKK